MLRGLLPQWSLLGQQRRYSKSHPGAGPQTQRKLDLLTQGRRRRLNWTGGSKCQNYETLLLMCGVSLQQLKSLQLGFTILPI